MNSAFNQALVRGLGQYSGGGELPRAIPNGIKLTYSPPKCHKWFLAATYNSKFPNALVNGSTLNTGAVLLYYMGQAGAPPYFTYEGHTYHCYYDSKRKELVLYVCFDGMQAQKSTTGHSTYVLFPSAGGSGGTLVTTVPNPQSSPTYRKEKHATRAGLGAFGCVSCAYGAHPGCCTEQDIVWWYVDADSPGDCVESEAGNADAAALECAACGPGCQLHDLREPGRVFWNCACR
jgi:hypothetical protein